MMRKYTDPRFERKIENKSNENDTQSAHASGVKPY